MVSCSNICSPLYVNFEGAPTGKSITSPISKNMMRKLLLILVAFTGLEAHAQNDSTFTIKGTIDTVPNATYFVIFNQKGVEIRDTITLDAESKFEYRGTITEPSRFHLGIENDFNPELVRDQLVYSFWVEPGKTLLFEGKTGWLVDGKFGLTTRNKQFNLKNSETEQLEQIYERHRKATFAKLSKQAVMRGEKPSGEIDDSIRNEYIRQNLDNFYSLYLLYTVARFPKEGSFAFVQEVLPRFPSQLQNTYLGKEIQRRLEINTKTAVGRMLPNFELPDTSSTLVQLSDFRGKYILVDFWASWCLPCRKQHPFLLEAKEKFSDARFDIISVSLDDSKRDWMKAIQQDQLAWTNLSDLKGSKDGIAKHLFIQGIPDNFLLDPEGTIIARKLHGRELLQELAEIFNEPF